jgi:hypothetical protein
MDTMTSENMHKIVLEIYETTVIKKEAIWYGKLLDIFDGRVDEKEISKTMDWLNDTCMIEEKYTTIEDNMWVKSITIDQDYLPCIAQIYNSTVKNEKCGDSP